VIHLIQSWTCVEGVGDGEVAQSGARWLDLSGYQDVIFFLDVSLRTAECTMHYDTAPLVDPTLFKSMGSDVISATPQLYRKRILLSDVGSTPPVASFIRWRIVSSAGGSNAWRLMFRMECLAKRLRGGT
jgi:hypothetical protein